MGGQTCVRCGLLTKAVPSRTAQPFADKRVHALICIHPKHFHVEGADQSSQPVDSPPPRDTPKLIKGEQAFAGAFIEREALFVSRLFGVYL